MENGIKMVMKWYNKDTVQIVLRESSASSSTPLDSWHKESYTPHQTARELAPRPLVWIASAVG